MTLTTGYLKDLKFRMVQHGMDPRDVDLLREYVRLMEERDAARHPYNVEDLVSRAVRNLYGVETGSLSALKGLGVVPYAAARQVGPGDKESLADLVREYHVKQEHDR